MHQDTPTPATALARAVPEPPPTPTLVVGVLLVVAMTLTLVSLWVDTTQLAIIAGAFILLLAVLLGRRLTLDNGHLRLRIHAKPRGRHDEADAETGGPEAADDTKNPASRA